MYSLSSALGGAHVLLLLHNEGNLTNQAAPHVLSTMVFSVRLNPDTKYRGVNSALPDFVHRLHIQSQQAFSGCQRAVLFRIRCTTGCAESVKPTQKHPSRHLRDYLDLLIMTSLQ